MRRGSRWPGPRVSSGPEREALFRRLVDQQDEAGSALNMATTLEIDAVIDPADTRAWLLRGLQAGGHRPAAARRFSDTW